MSINWTPAPMKISEFYEKLHDPVRGNETQAEYARMPKSQQDNLKDCRGGFVGGRLNGPRRKATAILGRDVVALDADNIPAGGTDAFISKVDALGYNYCIYSTRKHKPSKPRLRVLFPLDRECTADEYEPIARYLASLIDIDMMDKSTFECERLMYWPTVSADGEYVYRVGDKPLAPADGLLGTYDDWRDVTSWPRLMADTANARPSKAQEDPRTKDNIVGAFCRTYDVYAVMDELIPGTYAPVDGMTDRYTYLGGSTSGGAVVYDSGLWLYSHHATDPCGGWLVNAFDLARLHKFGNEDENAAAGTPTAKLPSYQKMVEFAQNDSKVAAVIFHERWSSVQSDFAGLVSASETDTSDTEWGAQLKPGSGKSYANTIENVILILQNDSRLVGRFGYNLFQRRSEALDALPWNAETGSRSWTDTDSNGLYWYLERTYGITKRTAIDSGMDVCMNANAFHIVKDYLNSLKWDGTLRLDTLYMDYLGAPDTPLNRAISRKSLVAAVARIMDPGYKYDQMVIFCGPQGIGKSTFISRLSKGWFNDSIRTFEGKEAAELLQGAWLIEIAELDAFNKSDVARIKQFLSLQSDRYRAAYGHFASEYPRSCIFYGTCNQTEFLQDTTGNRRFWVVNCGERKHEKTALHDMDDETVDQIWAEALMRWKLGEETYLTGDLEKEAAKMAESHRERSIWEGDIFDFLERPIPDDWDQWPLDKRKLYWSGAIVGDNIHYVPRTRVCPAEIWCEVLGGRKKDLTRGCKESREINNVLANIEGWHRSNGAPHCGTPYGRQRCYIKDTFFSNK